MKILVIGSGGREHALAWKIKQSPLSPEIFCAPGNGGMAGISQCVGLQPSDIDGLTAFAQKEQIDLTVVGPEIPLVDGIVDAFELAGLKIFGPRKSAARLEGSKVFAKEFMRKNNIPTAAFESFQDIDEARAYLQHAVFPLVVKADGLAAGKGVIICDSRAEAEEAVKAIMEDKVFQEAGQTVVIEECLKGEEASILAISDGEHHVILDSSQDHKRIFDEDQGPNTGGMGAYSPAPAVTPEMLRKIEARVIAPAILGMRQAGTPFKGVLYAGLMLTERGPMVLEFNVRFGDPETQAVLPRLKNDLLEILLAACESRLNEVFLEWDPRPCVCVVMSSGGYPGEYEKGKEIRGLEEADSQEDTVVFHAGTREDGGTIVTSGGRVLGVTSLGNGIEEAIRRAYEAVEKISFDRCFFRRDIGEKALKRLSGTRS